MRTIVNVQTGETTEAEDAPVTPETQEQIDARIAAELRAQALADAKLAAQADTTVQYLRDHTVAEVDAYIQANVTDLASAKVMLRRFGAVLCVLTKESL
jgi:hypothetical protein